MQKPPTASASIGCGGAGATPARGRAPAKARRSEAQARSMVSPLSKREEPKMRPRCGEPEPWSSYSARGSSSLYALEYDPIGSSACELKRALDSRATATRSSATCPSAALISAQSTETPGKRPRRSELRVPKLPVELMRKTSLTTSTRPSRAYPFTKGRRSIERRLRQAYAAPSRGSLSTASAEPRVGRWRRGADTSAECAPAGGVRARRQGGGQGSGEQGARAGSRQLAAAKLYQLPLPGRLLLLGLSAQCVAVDDGVPRLLLRLLLGALRPQPHRLVGERTPLTPRRGERRPQLAHLELPRRLLRRKLGVGESAMRRAAVARLELREGGLEPVPLQARIPQPRVEVAHHAGRAVLAEWHATWQRGAPLGEPEKPVHGLELVVDRRRLQHAAANGLRQALVQACVQCARAARLRQHHV
mmetsp:Transcript_34528/g.108437  ORF Transcript_34528/g.108437 Transcript_34528/m.108437 type:complete len:419 (-) Transcript_34528:103-1359(-)